MTVEVLSLCGLTLAGAGQAAEAMLDIDSGGPDSIDRLLVLDDTSLLDAHEPAYAYIETVNRVPPESMLCVLSGPRNGDGGRKLVLPGNLGGTHTPVLWVSRPAGIEWKVERSAVANRHPGPPLASLDRHPLIRLLKVDEMFDRVRRAFQEVPGGVASPGLWLAGAEDEAATFAGALAVAIQATCKSGTGTGAPFGELTPARAGGASLSATGPLARYLDRIAEMNEEATHALAGRGALGGMVRRGDNDVRQYVARVGEALADLAELVAHVLQDGSVAAGTGLTAGQRGRVRSAGIEFATEAAAPGTSQPGVAAAEQSLIYLTVARAIRGGDPLSLVARRLTATEGELVRVGSDKYLPEVANRCPPALLAKLASPPQKLPRRADTAAVRGELGLADADGAAGGLRDLILDVANREWSPAGVTSRQLAGARTALDGARKALTEHAGAAPTPGGPGNAPGGARGARITRLGESYLPALHDLALHVVAAELASPSATGQEALRAAHERTSRLVREWTAHVQAHGVAAQPSFVTSGTGGVLYVIEDDVASVRDALQYPVTAEMWQLCAPADLGALDVTAAVRSVRFAPRLHRDALIDVVPGEETAWTSSGSFAGLLRLVPLQAWAYHSGFAETSLPPVTES
ncbi:MAG TPA: hypothetical protein VHZ03_57715 [Trebonia sp.]|jgi:hypothetical protein|nr:hypothetical protein [Trebonia sp.]